MKKIFAVIGICLFYLQFIQAQVQVSLPKVDLPVYFDISPPLRDMAAVAPEQFDGSWKDGVVFNYIDPRIGTISEQQTASPLMQYLQQNNGYLPSDTTIQNFDGLLNGSGYVPPDTHGEAGLNYFFQTVNCSYAVYNKSGARVLGPLSNSSVWNGMPNNANSGDAIVLYDEQANRWLFSQFSLPNGSSTAPYYQMIAISQTADPTGSWYRYQYEFSSMPDYPKFGVWRDGYYMATNNFGPSPAGWVGNGAYAYDRTAMLAGSPTAQRVSFTLSPSGEGFISPLPTDCDGTFPPAGTPNYFTYIRTYGTQRLGLIAFHVDWANPGASTFGNTTYLNVAPFNLGGDAGDGIPQLGTDKVLETLADRLMYRLQYRNFIGYQSMVLNHTVNSGSGPAGVRWYELRNTGSGWSIYQQSTFAINDGNSRWMGSIAQDTAGTIALGYSVSGPTIHPGIRYTGRFKNDPINQMTIAEKAIIHGGGSQTGIWSGRSRWGDYSGMSVDPAAPTTFWFTTEYYSQTSNSNWQTRIGSFTFANVFSSAASATPSIMCSSSNDSVQLKAYGYGGTGTYTYSWSSMPAGFTSTSSSPKVKPSQTTTYIAATTNGTTTRTDTVKVQINLAPVASAGNDTTVCWYTPSIPMNAYAFNYNKVAWGTAGDGIFTHPNSVVTDYIPGIKDKTNGFVDLKLMVIPIAPCSGTAMDTKHVVLDPCTGIGEQKNTASAVNVFPNPADDFIFVETKGPVHDAVVTITDPAGRCMYNQPCSSKDGKPEKIDISAYQPGLYFVNLIQKDKTTVARFIVY
jgi:hypothetical protein